MNNRPKGYRGKRRIQGFKWERMDWVIAAAWVAVCLIFAAVIIWGY